MSFLLIAQKQKNNYTLKVYVYYIFNWCSCIPMSQLYCAMAVVMTVAMG